MKLVKEINNEILDFLFKTRTNPEIDKHLSGKPPSNYSEHVKYLQQKWENFRLLIDENGNYIGYSQIAPKENNSCELGFVISPDYQGKGFGKKLVELTLEEVKEQYNIVFLLVKKDNSKAIRMYEKFGFVTKKEIKKELYMEFLSRSN